MIPSSIFILFICLVVFLSWSGLIIFCFSHLCEIGFSASTYMNFLLPSLSFLNPFFPIRIFLLFLHGREERTSFVFLQSVNSNCLNVMLYHEMRNLKKEKKKKTEDPKEKEERSHSTIPNSIFFLLYLLCVKKKTPRNEKSCFFFVFISLLFFTNLFFLLFFF